MCSLSSKNMKTQNGKDIKISNINFKKHINQLNLKSHRFTGKSSRTKTPMQILQSHNSSFLPREKELSMGIYGTGFKERDRKSVLSTWANSSVNQTSRYEFIIQERTKCFIIIASFLELSVYAHSNTNLDGALRLSYRWLGDWSK